MQPPNPNRLHPHYPQIHSRNTNPSPNINPYQANSAYSYAPAPGTVVYHEAASVAVPPTYYPDPNWALHYPPTSYIAGGTIPQNGTEQLVPAIGNYSMWTNPTTQSVWCEVCGIECNTSDVLQQHKLGKKHVKRLKKLKQAVVPPPGGTIPQNGTEQLVPAIGNYSMWTNPTTQSVWCEVCGIECNTSDELQQHKLGKKHVKRLEKLKQAAVPPPGGTIPQNGTEQLVPAIRNNSVRTNLRTQSVWCEVCEIECDTSDVLQQHKLGKKHVKSLEKFKQAALEKLDTKKRKILEAGAAVDAVRMCEICNVVCNSEIVYKYHLAGSKHAAMMKKPATSVVTIN